MNKPIIGVTPLWDNKRDRIWMFPGYLKGIELAGGIPIILPLTEDKNILKQVAKRIDGILFTGGQDIHPEMYGQKESAYLSEYCTSRDIMEQILFEELVINGDKAALGICRGLQLFNVLLGGTLYQDIPEQMNSDVLHKQCPPYDVFVHAASLIAETPLFHLFNEKTIMVNSYHHQGIRKISDKLKAMAFAADCLVEAAYMPERYFVWGVQWHPEFTLNHETSKKLFSEFVTACCTNGST